MASSDRGALAESDLAELRARLVARRGELERVLARGAGDAEREVGDEIDDAERQVEINATMTEQARARALLAEVEAALQRMQQGRYGIGERSGEPISLARLRAIPWARDDIEESD
jgi:RNA polymerase-binding transcription factor DksA